MKQFALAGALLAAAMLAPLSIAPAFAAAKQELPSCTLTTDQAAPGTKIASTRIDCTATGSIFGTEATASKGDIYPEGPVSSGSGFLF